jgi:hypothetical protein
MGRECTCVVAGADGEEEGRDAPAWKGGIEYPCQIYPGS